jgi:hypothetical protein
MFGNLDFVPALLLLHMKYLPHSLRNYEHGTIRNFQMRNLAKKVDVTMENPSKISRRLSVKASEKVRKDQTNAKVHKRLLTNKLHQPFTHTKQREGQIPRIFKQVGKSQTGVQNFLCRYINRKKAACIR